ncbi:hypothetical protein ACQZV8_05145 [Magnetococcales bacterium HHB-1]
MKLFSKISWKDIRHGQVFSQMVAALIIQLSVNLTQWADTIPG